MLQCKSNCFAVTQTETVILKYYIFLCNRSFYSFSKDKATCLGVSVEDAFWPVQFWFWASFQPDADIVLGWCAAAPHMLPTRDWSQCDTWFEKESKGSLREGRKEVSICSIDPEENLCYFWKCITHPSSWGREGRKERGEPFTHKLLQPIHPALIILLNCLTGKTGRISASLSLINYLLLYHRHTK